MEAIQEPTRDTADAKAEKFSMVSKYRMEKDAADTRATAATSEAEQAGQERTRLAEVARKMLDEKAARAEAGSPEAENQYSELTLILVIAISIMVIACMFILICSRRPKQVVITKSDNQLLFAEDASDPSLDRR